MDGFVYKGFEIETDFLDALEEINEKIGFPGRTEFIDVEIYVNGKLFQRTYAQGFKTDNGSVKKILVLQNAFKNPANDEFIYEDSHDIYYGNSQWEPDFIHLLIDEDLEDINQRILSVNFYFKNN